MSQRRRRNPQLLCLQCRSDVAVQYSSDVAVRYRSGVAKIIAATPDCYDLRYGSDVVVRCRNDVAVRHRSDITVRYRSDVAIRLYCDLYTTYILIYSYKYISRITYFDEPGDLFEMSLRSIP